MMGGASDYRAQNTQCNRHSNFDMHKDKEISYIDKTRGFVYLIFSVLLIIVSL